MQNPPIEWMPAWARLSRSDWADLAADTAERVPVEGKYKVGRLTLRSHNRLVPGNLKLRGIVIWSIPAMTTCPVCAECKGACYALKAQVLREQAYRFRYENLYLWAAYPDLLEKMFLKQLHSKQEIAKYETFRLHESGDFFMQEYIDWWAALAKRWTAMRFYTYSKAESVLNLNPLEDAGVNIVRSYIPTMHGHVLNFTEKKGDVAAAKDLLKRSLAESIVCPATIKKGIKCGEKRWGGHCTWCLTHRFTVFVKH